MPKVNLVPREEQAREFRRQFYIVPVAGAMLIVGFLGGSYYYYSNQLQNADEQLQQIKSSNDAMQKQVDELGRYADTKKKKDAQQNVVNSLYNQRVRWSRTLDDLAFIIPEDVWLTSIKATVPNVQTAQAKTGTASKATTQRDIQIDGYTREMPSVATFLVRLGLIASITDVTLDSAEKEKLGTETVTHFKISATLKQTGDTQQPAVAPTTGEGGASPMTPTTGTTTSGSTMPTGTTSRTTGTTR